jgi:hypothetical protein
MGPLMTEVYFDTKISEKSQIAEKLKELSGMAVRIRQKGEGNLYDLHISLAFESEPDHEIELTAYRAGAVRKSMEDASKEYAAMLPPEFARTITGYEEPPGKQTLHLRDYRSYELTLATYTLLAMEALGGKLAYPLSEESRQMCAQPLTPQALERREWKSFVLIVPVILLSAIFTPFYLIFGSSGIDSSRKHMNKTMKKVHEWTGESGDPPQIGRLRYAWGWLCMLPFKVFTVIAAAIGAMVYILYLPIALILYSARYALRRFRGRT